MKTLRLSVVAVILVALSACMGTSSAKVERQVVGLASCPGMSAISAAHMQQLNGLPVRCGPQTQLPYTLR